MPSACSPSTDASSSSPLWVLSISFSFFTDISTFSIGSSHGATYGGARCERGLGGEQGGWQSRGGGSLERMIRRDPLDAAVGVLENLIAVESGGTIGALRGLSFPAPVEATEHTHLQETVA